MPVSRPSAWTTRVGSAAYTASSHAFGVPRKVQSYPFQTELDASQFDSFRAFSVNHLNACIFESSNNGFMRVQALRRRAYGNQSLLVRGIVNLRTIRASEINKRPLSAVVASTLRVFTARSAAAPSSSLLFQTLNALYFPAFSTQRQPSRSKAFYLIGSTPGTRVNHDTILQESP